MRLTQKIQWVVLVMFIFAVGWGVTVRAEDAVLTNTVVEFQNGVFESIIAPVEGIRHVKEEADLETQEAKVEKIIIEMEKEALVESLQEQHEDFSAGNEGKKEVILEKLETVKKKEEVVTTKQALATKKKETYEQIIALIEQKLAILRNPNISYRALNRELIETLAELQRLKLEKPTLQGRIVSNQQEIKLLEQDIAAKTILIEFKGASGDYIKESIVAQNERLRLAKQQIDQFNKRKELIDSQINIVNDYLVVLNERKKERFQQELMTPIPYRFSPEEQKQMVLITILLLLLALFSKKIEQFLLNNITVVKRQITNYFKMGVFLGCVFLAIYIGATYIGYHALAYYLGRRIILSLVILGLMNIVYRWSAAVITYLCCREVDKEEVKPSTQSPVFAFLKLLSWMGAMGFAIYTIFSIWDMENVRMLVLGQVIQHSFFKIGQVDLSLMLILKISVIIWSLNFFSHFINKFLNKNVYPRARLDEGAQYTISIFVKYFLIFLGGVTGLKILGFEIGTLNVLAGTIGIGIGIGLQEIAKNFISGLILLIERPVKIGDYVEIEGLPGRVDAIKARGTVVTTFDNISVVVPNSDFITKQVVNWTYNDKITRCCLSVGVTYGSDVDLVKKSLLEVAGKHSKIIRKPPPYVLFAEFGDNALLFKLYVWTEDSANRLLLISDLHFMVEKMFRERGLVIAFPQRDIHLKTSDVVFNVRRKDAVTAENQGESDGKTL